jgi:phage shock protein PspC (stress-responsive transcriptional regulator)
MTEPPREPGEPPEPSPPEPDAEQPTEPQVATTATSPARPRRLERSRDDRVIAGVCGGLGAYFDVDSVLFRIAFVLLVFAGGLGILAYILGWIFLPEEPRPGERSESAFDRAADAMGDDRRSGAVVLGIVFVGLGILFLLDVAWPDFLSWQYVWPIALIAVGAAIILRARR